ncbi:DUF4407 domain-containing protein [Actinoplanes sp. NPDC026619]|uniref:DUF4407 domain-containing protein n=1 Tax=Actinoplanes sp. NPDC026619 TaxID=3155798 RepID=UPI0033DBAAE6
MAATLAGVGTFVSVGFWIYGRVLVSPATVLFGLAGGLLIFVFDRALVRAPLNPYRFPREVLEALWNPSADSKWFAVLNDALISQPVGRRIGQLGGVAVAAVFRVGISLCISFLVAETVLFVAFQPEVNERVRYIRSESTASAVQAENTFYKNKRDQLNSEVETLQAAGDPLVQATGGKLDDSRKALRTAQDDKNTLDSLKAREVAGESGCVVLSDKEKVCSTGESGYGPMAKNLDETLTSRTAILRQRKTDVTRQQTAYDAAHRAAAAKEKGNAPQVADLRRTLAQETGAHTARLADLRTQSTHTDGLLIRHQAVDALAHDLHPETVEPDEVKACGGLPPARFVCAAWRAIWLPTPMGSYVAALRWLFVLVDLMPIFLKLQLSLRRRRPYDTIRAALEERYVANAVDVLDERLEKVGELLEKRASARKAGRTETGAEHILKSDPPQRDKPPAKRAKPRLTPFSRLIENIRQGIHDDDEDDDPRLRPPGDGPGRHSKAA